MDGLKYAEGNLVISENRKEGWQVLKQFNLYVTKEKQKASATGYN